MACLFTTTELYRNRDPDLKVFLPIFTAQRVCIVRTMLSQDVRLSVRYAHVSKRLNTSPRVVHQLVDHHSTPCLKKLCIFFCQNFVKFPLILITFGRLDGKMAEIVCYVCIFLMSLQYLVKGGYSKFLPNTGFVAIRLLRFGVKIKRAYCRNNFLAQRPLPDMGKLSGDDFFMFQQDVRGGTAPRRISTRNHRFPGARERDARNASSSRRLSPCTRSTFRARILTILSRSVMTTNNSAK